MTAVLRHELSSYFTNVTGYVFGAFLLLFAGIYTMVINLQSASPYFEYVLMVDGVIPVQNQLGNGDELISLLKQCLDDGRQGFRGVQGGVMEQHNGAGLDLGGDPLGNFSC